MTETTYWIIVVAVLAAAVAIWLLTRPDPPKAAKKPRPSGVEAEPVTPEPEPEIPPEEPEPAVPPSGKPKGKRAKAGPPDPLTTLKGLGPKAAARLNELGVTRFDQIAAWSDEDVARIAPQLGNFRDRVVRDRWVEQAGHLAIGDTAGFEAKFGKLG